jgi:hypothetical protein
MNNEEITPQSKYFTLQWYDIDVARLLKKSSMTNPEFDVTFKEMERSVEDGLVKVQLTFRNVGRTQYHKKLINFIVKSLYKQL